MKQVSCEPLDSNESSEIAQPAQTCPNKVLPFLEETMRNLHRDQFLPEIKTYVASEIEQCSAKIEALEEDIQQLKQTAEDECGVKVQAMESKFEALKSTLVDLSCELCDPIK